jgi:8-oxo-dGTP pyrophosphatase MutT (NUDIX family)
LPLAFGTVGGMPAENPGPVSDARELITTSSTVVYSNRWITVREDQTLRPDGSAGMYGVVHKADFVLIVPFADGGFHLVEQYRYAVRRRYWEFPQGASEDSPGTDPVVLARAELAEETGLSAATLTRLGWLFPSYGFCDHGFHIMVATGLTPGPARPEPDEVGMRSAWFSEAAVWQLIADGKITDAHTVAALGLFQHHRAAYGW